MKPATNSDSASTRSNGGRLVSASAETKNTTNIGNNASQCQSSNEFVRPSLVPIPAFCELTMSVTFSEPTQRSTQMMTKPIETSYDTICAADLRLPMKGYFEFDA